MELVMKNRKAAVKPLPDFSALEFGKYISPNMFLAVYKDGEWNEGSVVPFANLSLSPAALALHYGQTVFEGMKAFKTANGSINIFRAQRHWERFNNSLDRMCMPPVPFDLFEKSLKELVQTDRNWVPDFEDGSFYLRPFMFASEERFGVKIADEYMFIVFGGPVPSLYAEPLSVKVETHFSRATKGGTGYAKCGGNYGAAFYPTKKAREEGFDQVIWTDSSDHGFIEESGTMNIMFVENGKLLTPALHDSILDGVTRNSLIMLAKQLGIQVDERAISVNEVRQGIKNGDITEVFGVGTAAVVAPIKRIGIEGEDFLLSKYSSDSIMYKLKNALDEIRSGAKPDLYGWNMVID